jgi:hypothetical protein
MSLDWPMFSGIIARASLFRWPSKRWLPRRLQLFSWLTAMIWRSFLARKEYPAEFRRRALDLVAAGKTVAEDAAVSSGF